MPLHTGQNGHCNQINKQQELMRMWKKGNPCALLIGMKIDAATVENNMELPQNTKNETAF